LHWTIEFDSSAAKTLRKIDRKWQTRIVGYLEEIAALPDPRNRGKALSGTVAGLWRYRVGDYRLICQLQDNVLVVHVVKIGHRREVYD
jgi:mRNA interferase RelE/StbE